MPNRPHRVVMAIDEIHRVHREVYVTEEEYNEFLEAEDAYDKFEIFSVADYEYAVIHDEFLENYYDACPQVIVPYDAPQPAPQPQVAPLQPKLSTIESLF